MDQGVKKMPAGNLLRQNVGRQFDTDDFLLGQRFLDGDLSDARHLHRVGDDGLVGADIFVDSLQIDCLKKLCLAFGVGKLTRQCDYAGKSLMLGIEQTVDQMQRSRAHGSGTNAGSSTNGRLRIGGVGGIFLMVDTDPGEPAVAAQRIGERIESISCNAKNVSYTVVGQ